MRRGIIVGLAAAMVGALAGCSSLFMKGTPLYTGEHPKREGPAEDRVNLWPLAYYRAPALSILWPLMEATDDHLALRPFYSVYKLDKPHHEYNVLAPFAQFDYDTNQHHVLPVDWGIDSQKRPYFNVLPLVWSGQDANDKPYFNAVPFVWSGYDGNKQPYFVGFPVYWSGRDERSRPWTVVFPLVWWFPDVRGVVPVFWTDTTFTVFPFAWYSKDEYCYVPPFWVHRQLRDGYDNHVLWPIGRRLKTAEKDGFDVWPFYGSYSGTERGEPWSMSYALWPLARAEHKGDFCERWIAPVYYEHREPGSSHFNILPFYHHAVEGGSHRTLTPLYSFGGDARSNWDLAVPLFYRKKEGNDWLTVTPLWSGGRDGKTRWDLVPPVYYRKTDGQESLTLTPLWWSGREPKAQWDVVLPAYFHEKHGDNWTTLTPLWSGGRDGTTRWDLVPPVYYRKTDGQESLTLTPLWWSGRDLKGQWDLVLPVYYHEKQGENWTTLTPLWSGGRDGTTRWDLVPPVYYRKTDGKESLTLTPLWWSGRDAKGQWDFVLPVYYHEKYGNESLTLSPVWLSRTVGESHWEAVPPVYFHSKDPEGSLTISPLSSHGESGPIRWRSSLPFYYERHNAETKTDLYLTPLAGWEVTPEHRRTTIFPLLSSMTWRGDEKDFWFLAPLSRFRWGGEARQSHILPFYYYDGKEKLFLSLPYSHQDGPDGGFTNLLGLVSHSTWDKDGRHTLTLPLALSQLNSYKGVKKLDALLGLGHAEWGGEARRSYLAPFYYYDGKEKLFLSLPYSHQDRPDGGFTNLLGLVSHSTWTKDGRHDLTLPFALTHFSSQDGGAKELNALLGLGHAEWGGEARRFYLIPFFYHDDKESVFLSPVASWQFKPDEGFINVLGVGAQYTRFGSGKRAVVVPAALSGFSWKDGERDLAIGLGLLAHAEWGGAKLRHHVFPLYGYDRENSTFLSLPVSWGNSREGSFLNILGVGAHYERQGDERSLRVLPPLTYFGRSTRSSRTTVLPLFSWSRERKHAAPDVPDSTEALWIAPWGWSEKTIVSEFDKRGAAGAARTGMRRTSEFFPFWLSTGSKDLATGEEKADFSLLGPLYEYQYRSRVEWTKDPKDVSDYTRARILWRVMHYERTGGDSTLDVFPFITSDRRADGSRQFSFLWRLYRNGRTAAGGRNLDILFIPILRHRP